jgi:endonuclease/exonuclease/phosphatase family metal-dependent hydrolase
VVTWNLAYMTPATYRADLIRERQWRFLFGLDADVMMLQECRPNDLAGFEPDHAHYEIVGSIPPRRSACSAVVAKTELHLTAASLPGALFECLRGYLAVASVDTPFVRLLVASVHTPAQDVRDPHITDELHSRLRRSGGVRAWYNDVAFAALDAVPKESGFIFAGDWNTARRFDETYPGGGASGTEFFDRAAERGWSDTMHLHNPNEVPTFLPAPYENDRIFTDGRLHQRLEAYEVHHRIGGAPAVELSDHAPIVADWDLSASA